MTRTCTCGHALQYVLYRLKLIDLVARNTDGSRHVQMMINLLFQQEIMVSKKNI